LPRFGNERESYEIEWDEDNATLGTVPALIKEIGKAQISGSKSI
jgi:hypothetical protein